MKYVGSNIFYCDLLFHFYSVETWGNILYLGKITDTQKSWEENPERDTLGDKGLDNLLHRPGSLENQMHS